LLHVQFRETENSWRLDSSYRGGHPRDIPRLVDASDVSTVNALKTLPAWSMREIGMFHQLTSVALHVVESSPHSSDSTAHEQHTRWGVVFVSAED